MKIRPVLVYLVNFAVLLAVWQIGSILLGSTLLPGPWTVLLALIKQLVDFSFWDHIFTSFFRILAGVFFALITAVPCGLLLGSNERLDRWTAPLIYMSYPVPKIIFLPIILLLFGLGDGSKIMMIALIIFFQLLITTRDSARQIDHQIRYSFQSLGGTGLQYFRHVVWPACLPGIFTALRIGVGTAVAGLFFVESISARSGVGIYIIDAWGRADYVDMFVGMVVLSMIGIILYEIFDKLEKYTCRWQYLK